MANNQAGQASQADESAIPDENNVLRAHGYHSLAVKQVVPETHDATSYVLDIPDSLRDTFRYEPGQFCTFRVHLGDDEYIRSYSMSSAPETDTDLTVTVKRVAGGVISNWFLDYVAIGDVLDSTKPSGVFCLQARDTPVVAYCGGSGVTPVISIAKKALSASSRRVKILYANRSRDSVIFENSLQRLQTDYPGRLEIHHHFDSDSGFLNANAIAEFAADALDGDFYICGPGPFMDLVEPALIGMGIGPANIFIERFLIGGDPLPVADTDTDTDTETDAETDNAKMPPESVTIIMKGRRTAIPYQRGDTVLDTARRGSLKPPFSCESGNCATCMAILREGSATMRLNNALTPEEVDEGWILTCQALPFGPTVTVEYEAI